jgi:hypothetical protein
VFTGARNSNKSTVGLIKRPGIRQEQWWHLWRSGFRYYLWAHLTFGDQLREWQARHCRPLFEAETLKFRWRRAPGSLLAAFLEVWLILIVFCSGGLAINCNSHLFYNVYCQRCKCYFSWSCLLLQYQWRTGIHCINSVAICRGSTPSSLVLIFFVIVYRQFHLQFFLFEALFRLYTSGALFDLVGTFYNGTSQTS